MAVLIQKVIVHDGADASNILPMHVVLCNEDGSAYGGGGTAATAATTSAAGVVKKASNTAEVASPDATSAASETVTKAEFDAVVTLLNECKAQLNDHLAKVKSAGQMA